jgi:hypothetical protein
MISRRFFVTSSIVSLCAAVPRSASLAAQAETVFTPEMFGAKGDGTTNDTAAFWRLSQSVMREGGGIIRLRRTTYLVGEQQRRTGGNSRYSYSPREILQLEGLREPLHIEGNGAKLKCAPGLKYGTFSPVTGRATKHPMPNLNAGELATPYDYMILVRNCSGSVTISDLELDGSLGDLEIGGQYGDTGWQVPAVGIYLVDNRGDEIVRDVFTHHHAQDGIMISGSDNAALAARVSRRVENLRSEYNGRQGCSIIGGRGYQFSNCQFNQTGKAGLSSAPGAGLDIEAEGKTIRALSFRNCQFLDNSGCGMVADSGDTEGASFTGCSFVGTTNWSAWPRKPLFRFRDCRFVGSIVQCYGDPDPVRAAQFESCIFTDNPALSPNGKVFREGRADGSLANLGETRNVLFKDCSFLADHGAVLPWSLHVIYQDCTMRQKVRTTQGFPRGHFRGRNQITGNVDLYSSKISGELVLNGTQQSG